MARQLFRRYIWLLDTIKSADGITLEEINRKWRRSALNEDGKDIPLRTFHAHREAIWEEFEIEITCDRRDNTYRITESFDAYGSVKAHLVDAFIMDNALREIPAIRNCIVSNDAVPNRNHTVIIQAIQYGRPVRFRYHNDFINEQGSADVFEQRVLLEPYGLYFSKSWFLIGRSPRNGQVLVFNLDNLDGMGLAKGEYTIPKDFDVKHFGDTYSWERVSKSESYQKAWETNQVIFDDGADLRY